MRSDGFAGKIILRVALRELAAGIEQEEFASTILRLGLVEQDDDARRAGVVEEVLRQVDDAFDQVLLDEPAADVLFLVAVGVAGAAGGGAGVEDDGGPAVSLRLARMIWTQPQSALLPGKPAPFGKAVELVGVVVGFLAPVLVPHRIGDDAVEGLEAVAVRGTSDC